jgi:hypothetical protein
MMLEMEEADEAGDEAPKEVVEYKARDWFLSNGREWLYEVPYRQRSLSFSSYLPVGSIQEYNDLSASVINKKLQCPCEVSRLI